MNSDVIYIALCFDKRMLKYALVFIESLIFYNKNQRFSFHCFFPYNEITEFALFEETLKSTGNHYKFHIISKEIINSLPDPSELRFSKSVFFRFFIPEMIPAEIHKILYCDVDILINGTIRDLWQTNIHDSPLAAVYDSFRMKFGKEDIRKLYKRKGDAYFNTGVLLINNEYWRKHDARKQLLEYVTKNISELDLPDQDAINYYFGNSIKVLSPKWNYFNGPAEMHVNNFKDFYSKDELNEAKQSPVIIHFSYKRPDDPYCFHNKKYLFDRFLRHSKHANLFNKLTLSQKIKHFILSKAEPKRRSWILAGEGPEYKRIIRIFCQFD